MENQFLQKAFSIFIPLDDLDSPKRRLDEGRYRLTLGYTPSAAVRAKFHIVVPHQRRGALKGSKAGSGAPMAH